MSSCLTSLVAVQGHAPVQITVRCEDGREVQIKAYPQTPLQKVFSAVIERLSLGLDNLVLHMDGVQLRPEQSLQQADILDGDVIDCMFRMTGD